MATTYTKQFTADAVLRYDMTDPLQSLIAFLKENWTLTGDLGVDEVKFSTGWYDENFKAPQITLTEIVDTDEPFELGYGVILVTSVLQLDIWVTLRKTSNIGLGIAKGWRWKLRREITRILKEAHVSIPDVWEVILNRTGRNLDESDASPPKLRYSKEFTVTYKI